MILSLTSLLKDDNWNLRVKAVTSLAKLAGHSELILDYTSVF